MEKKDIKNILVKGIVIIGAFALKKAAENLIEKKLDKRIPQKPDKIKGDSWSGAIQYAALSGAMLGTAKLLMERTTEQQLDKVL